MNEYPGWLLDLVIRIVELEEEHPKLFEAGEKVTYNLAVPGLGFESVGGTLIGKQWYCFTDLVTRDIPHEVITAAIYYKKGKEATA